MRVEFLEKVGILGELLDWGMVSSFKIQGKLGKNWGKLLLI